MLKKYWDNIFPNKTKNAPEATYQENIQEKKLTKQEYIAALEKMKKSPQDRLGLLSEIGITWAGATVGFVAAGAAASAVGATTLLGSSTLAGLLGGVFVTSTPVGWLVGGAVLAGGAAYGLTKVLKGSTKVDSEKEKNIKAMEEHIQALDETQENPDIEEQMTHLIEKLQMAVELGFSQKKSNQILVKVFNNKIPVKKATSLIDSYIENHKD